MQRSVLAMTVLVFATRHVAMAEPVEDIANRTEVASAKVEDQKAAQAVRAFASGAGKIGTKIILRADGTIESLYVGFLVYSPDLLEHLHGLVNLEYLCLNGPQVTDEVMPHLTQLSSLKCLNLGCAKMSDNGRSSTNITGAGLRHLKALTQLRDLRLTTRQRIDDVGLSHLAGLTNLELLYIENNEHSFSTRLLPDRQPKIAETPNITDKGLVHLKKMTKIDYLMLRKTDVRGPGLIHLRGMHNLKHLYLHGSPVTDVGIEHLTTLKKLEWIGLGGTKVSDEGVEQLRLALPACKVGAPK